MKKILIMIIMILGLFMWLTADAQEIRKNYGFAIETEFSRYKFLQVEAIDGNLGRVAATLEVPLLSWGDPVYWGIMLMPGIFSNDDWRNYQPVYPCGTFIRAERILKQKLVLGLNSWIGYDIGSKAGAYSAQISIFGYPNWFMSNYGGIGFIAERIGGGGLMFGVSIQSPYFDFSRASPYQNWDDQFFYFKLEVRRKEVLLSINFDFRDY